MWKHLNLGTNTPQLDVLHTCHSRSAYSLKQCLQEDTAVDVLPWVIDILRQSITSVQVPSTPSKTKDWCCCAIHHAQMMLTESSSGVTEDDPQTGNAWAAALSVKWIHKFPANNPGQVAKITREPRLDFIYKADFSTNNFVFCDNQNTRISRGTPEMMPMGIQRSSFQSERKLHGGMSTNMNLWKSELTSHSQRTRIDSNLLDRLRFAEPIILFTRWTAIAVRETSCQESIISNGVEFYESPSDVPRSRNRSLVKAFKATFRNDRNNGTSLIPSIIGWVIRALHTISDEFTKNFDDQYVARWTRRRCWFS